MNKDKAAPGAAGTQNTEGTFLYSGIITIPGTGNLLQYVFILMRAIEHTHNNNLLFYLVNQVKDNIAFDNQFAVAMAI